MVRSQLGQKLVRFYLKKTNTHKKKQKTTGKVVKVQALSSNPCTKNKTKTQAGGLSQCVKCLSNRHEALSSNYRIPKTKEDQDNIYLENAIKM
jgi:hypothetical protein